MSERKYSFYNYRAARAILYLTLFFILAANPIAGLFWESRAVVLFIYMLRDLWILIAPVMLVFQVIKGVNQPVLLLFVIGIVHFFVSVILNLDTLTPAIIFLQFRNTFGYLLAWIFACAIAPHISRESACKLTKLTVWALFLYCALEFASMYLFGINFAEDIFNKELLEQTKGTKANLDAGILGLLRVPGPLFSPSQLGIFAAFLYFACRVLLGKKGVYYGLLILFIQIITISKTGMGLMLVAELLFLLRRPSAIGAVVCISLLPFAVGQFLPLLPDYHQASITRHFLGFKTALEHLLVYPAGVGIGSVGTLAATLTGNEFAFGFESGVGTVLGNLGFTGVLMLSGLFVYFYNLSSRVPIYLFTLYYASIAFNENALSPHMFVIAVVLCRVATLTDKPKRSLDCRL